MNPGSTNTSYRTTVVHLCGHTVMICSYVNVGKMINCITTISNEFMANRYVYDMKIYHFISNDYDK